MKIDISNDIELKNSKGNPFGWSQCEIHYQNERIGWIENGEICDLLNDYSFELKKINDNKTQCVIYKHIGK